MAKIKVAYAITKGNWGGAQRYVYDLATGLPDERFEPVVACGEGGLLEEKLNRAGIRTVKIADLERDIKGGADFRSFLSLIKLFHREKPDIVHLNSPKAGGLGGLAGRLTGVKSIIYTSHGWTFNESRPRWQTGLIKLLSWLIILLAHRVIVIAESERRAVAKWPWLKSRLRLVHNGISPIDLLPRDEARRMLIEKIGQPIDNGGIWLGTIAELHKNKGLDYAVQAMAELVKGRPELKWVVIGEGEKRRHLEQIIAESGLKNRFFLAGEIAGAAELLSAFDIFILPSIKEGLPYTVLEAGATGRAVIASAVGGVPEIIISGRTGLLIQAADPFSLTAQTQIAIASPSLRQRLGRNLAERIQKYFAKDKMIGQTIKIYGEVRKNSFWTSSR